MSAKEELNALDREEIGVVAELTKNGDEQDVLLERRGVRKQMLAQLKVNIATLQTNLRNLHEAPSISIVGYQQVRHDLAEARGAFSEIQQSIVEDSETLVSLESREDILTEWLADIERRRDLFGRVIAFTRKP